MKYHFKIHKEGNKYWAQGIELDSCFAQAGTLPELYENIQDALNFYLEEPIRSKELAPLPDESIKPNRTVLEVEVDPAIAFSFLIRRSRILHGLTQQQAAKKMGFDKLYSYQRLESKRCNPSLKILSRAKKVFPELSLDAIFEKHPDGRKKI